MVLRLFNILLLSLCLSFAACASQQLSADQEIVLPDGSRYTGTTDNGLLHGAGVLVWRNGDRYEGEFAQGVIAGFGRLTLASGEVFEGEFVDGKLHGKGHWQGGDGASYRGEFVDDEFHGEGIYQSEEGEVYTGQFENDELTGLGTYQSADGWTYAGEFNAWRYHGAGVWQGESQRYTGEFKDGYFDGFGELVDVASGDVVKAGQWRWGRYVASTQERSEKKTNRAEFEHSLFQQSSRLANAKSMLTASQPGEVDVFGLLIAGDGTQTVFDSELRKVAAQLQPRYLAADKRILLSNFPDSAQELPLATRSNIQASLDHLRELMQVEEDILLLYITSHGSESHDISLKAPAHNFVDIDVRDWQRWLGESDFQWQIVMVSACYSGGILPVVAKDSALVMTAAAADKSSFGCGDNDTMTYFGRALFEKALPEAPGLNAAFEQAKTIIGQWEEEQELTPSEPQITLGEKMAEKLTEWEQERR